MLQAVIFDLDGTILDNEQLWEEAFQKVKENHPDLMIKDPGQINGWLHEPGIGVGPNWDKLVGEGELSRKLDQETHDEYWKLVGDVRNVPIREGVVEVLEDFKQKGYLTALATGSTWKTVEGELEALDLYLAFDVTTTGDELTRSKPDPEIYFLTAQKLGVEPEDCLVVEDSLAGIIAAREAGMKVVGITSSYLDSEDLEAAGANHVVDNLAEVMIISADHGNKEQKTN